MPNPPEFPRLLIPQPVFAAMIAQAAAELPNECCGILGGPLREGDTVREAVIGLPLVNAAASPVEFESEPQSMFAAVRTLRQLGLDVVAVYHSHPTSPPVPSRTDLARNFSDRVVNLIMSLQSAQPEVRAWWLSDAGYQEAAWEVMPSSG
jgi:[CysO sulfur-carrier protein]-S-L-cysteine hydrolase